jgi:hypothetical protein
VIGPKQWFRGRSQCNLNYYTEVLEERFVGDRVALTGSGLRNRRARIGWNMPESRSSLDDPRHSGRSLFALKRIAEALQAEMLTYCEAKAAAMYISPHYGEVFDQGVGTTSQKAARVVRMIEAILERRFPKRFRANPER